MVEALLVVCFSVVIIAQAVIGARRSEAEAARIERAYKLNAAETPAERIAALLPERKTERTASRDPERPTKPIGL